MKKIYIMVIFLALTTIFIVEPWAPEPKITLYYLSMISALVNQCYIVRENKSTANVVGSKV